MLSYHAFFISMSSSIMSMVAFNPNKPFAKTDQFLLCSGSFIIIFCGYMAIICHIFPEYLLAAHTLNNLQPAK